MDQELKTVTATFPRSHTAIAGHPVHAILVNFPIAFLTGALISDVVYLISQDAFWAQAAYWLLIAGLVSGAVAAAVGSVDFWSNPHIRSLRAAWAHMIGNVIILVIVLINILARANNIEAAVVPQGILLSAITGALLFVTGWFGGALVYEHRVGVQPASHAEAQPASEAMVDTQPGLPRS
ncbi:MAG: DUF2231 domain-containing protein [Chloroflexota bacterium]|nr:DUF2231 domain-containing protein [Chloroflexota bacterium]